MPTDGPYDYNWSAEQRRRSRELAARRKARRAAKWQKIKDDFARKRASVAVQPEQETTE